MIAETHHMWSIYGSETAVSETAISQLQNRSKYRILHSTERNLEVFLYKHQDRREVWRDARYCEVGVILKAL